MPPLSRAQFRAWNAFLAPTVAKRDGVSRVIETVHQLVALGREYTPHRLGTLPPTCGRLTAYYGRPLCALGLNMALSKDCSLHELIAPSLSWALLVLH